MSSQPCCLISSMLQECGVVQQNLIYGNKRAKNTFHSIAKMHECFRKWSCWRRDRTFSLTWHWWGKFLTSQKYTAVINTAHKLTYSYWVRNFEVSSHCIQTWYVKITEHRVTQHSIPTLFTHNTLATDNHMQSKIQIWQAVICSIQFVLHVL